MKFKTQHFIAFSIIPQKFHRNNHKPQRRLPIELNCQDRMHRWNVHRHLAPHVCRRKDEILKYDSYIKYSQMYHTMSLQLFT